MIYAFRKSAGQEDSLKIAVELSNNFNILPYDINQLASVIRAGTRIGEIILEKSNGISKLINIEEWFKERLMPNTIPISTEMYKKALYRAFRLIVLANIAKTDFGSSRQRDFGQRLTDFTRGFLGEIVLESFFLKKFGIKVESEEKDIGDVAQFLSTDIKYVWEKYKKRISNLKLSIKTSKLPSLWLDIPASQLAHSEIFCFIKVGLTVDHFAIFMKEIGFIEKFVEMAQKLGEVEADKVNQELNLLLSSIPSMQSWPAYIVGFVSKEDLETGKLIIRKKGKKSVVTGGRGFFSGKDAKELEGIGEISGNRYVSGSDALSWDENSWNKIIKKL